MAVIHPDVESALRHADAVHEHLLRHIEKMRAVSSERLSADRDIAVKVDMSGQLADLWIKPGTLDRRTPAEIAKEIGQLVTAAGADAADEVAALYRSAHQFPEQETEADPAPANSQPSAPR